MWSGRDRCHSGGFLPRIILESAAEGRCRYGRCRRNRFSLRQRKTESDAEPRSRYGRCMRAILYSHNDCAASIRKFGPEIKNRCTQEGVNGEKLASIRKSGLEIKNRCTLALRRRSAGGTISFAAAENGIGCGHRCRNGRCRGNHSPSRQRRMESDADLIAATAAAGRRSNPGQSLQRFSSLTPEIRNHCSPEGDSGENLAVIPKFTP